MSTLEKLREAFAESTPGDWTSTGVVVAVPAEGGMEYLLQGCRADGIKNDPDVEFAALAHNLMPTLLEAVGVVEAVAQGEAINAELEDRAAGILYKLLYGKDLDQ